MMAIDAVTTAIIARIKASLGNQQGVRADSFIISLASPDEGASDAALVLFLYLVTPDPELRNADRRRPYPNPDDPPRLFAPAVPLELRFLATIGAGAPTGTAGLSRLAGAIRAIESGSPLSVPEAFQEAVWLSLLPLTSDEMARIWGLFPNENCRASFAFRAAPVWIDPRDPADIGAPVGDDQFRSSRLEGTSA
jgi:hypothetical protein